jgi:Asp-tRNA(Asn)/Glu-tRNA(Gln) amidotransferase A subunit family amidase
MRKLVQWALIITLCKDDPEVQDGTPVGLQLVGRRFQEEKMLGLVEMFEKALARGKGTY